MNTPTTGLFTCKYGRGVQLNGIAAFTAAEPAGFSTGIRASGNDSEAADFFSYEIGFFVSARMISATIAPVAAF